MKLIQHIRETKAELRHVVWPTHKHTMVSTLLVIVVSFGVAYYLGLFDVIFEKLLKQFILF
ncbi:MAG: preprotein translocase subunit SecE [Candidatus Pacebacteria bacterium]|nr:preprotein translocase subunit SecE [Candidatus Paceibacterota bacterium]